MTRSRKILKKREGLRYFFMHILYNMLIRCRLLRMLILSSLLSGGFKTSCNPTSIPPTAGEGGC